MEVHELAIHVEHVGHYVHFYANGDKRRMSDLNIKGWREWARNARVVARGKEQAS